MAQSLLPIAPMSNKPKNAREWLSAEFERRKARQPGYSLRRFAQQIGIPSGRLSELMSGKRNLTQRMAIRISENLLLKSDDRAQLMRVTSNSGHPEVNEHYQMLSADDFYALADWYHFAIINLMETDDFQSDAQWIAKRLNLSQTEVRSAIERLIRLGLITRSGDQLVKKGGNITTTHDIESLALRVSHRQSLEKALSAMDNVPLELRDITSISMAIDMNKIPVAKQMIKKFRRELCAFLESGPSKSEVYELNLQLIPTTQISPKKASSE